MAYPLSPKGPKVPSFGPGKRRRKKGALLPGLDMSGEPESLDSILAGNEKTRQKLIDLGIDPPAEAKTDPTVLDRVFGVLRTPAVGVQSVLHNVTTGGADVNPLKEMGKSLRGEESIDFDHILTDYGWRPKDWVGKTAKWAVSFAGEVVTDPVTWFTMGTEGAVRSLAAEGASTLSKTGITLERAQQLAKAGAPKLLEYFGDDVTRIAVKELEKDASRELWRALVREGFEKVGTGGGLRFRNLVTGKEYKLIPGKYFDAVLPPQVRSFVDAAVEAVAVRSPFTKFADTLQESGKVLQEAHKFDASKLIKAKRGNDAKFQKIAKEALDEIGGDEKELLHAYRPAVEETLDNPEAIKAATGTVRSDIKAAQKRVASLESKIAAREGYINAALEEKRHVDIEAIGELGVMKRDLKRATQRLNEMYALDVDWDAYRAVMKRKGFSPEQIAKAEEVAKKSVQNFSDLYDAQTAMGVRGAGGKLLRSKGKTYTPHIVGDTKGEIASIITNGKVTDDVLRNAEYDGRGIAPFQTPTHGKARKMDSIAEGLEQGVGYRTFGPELEYRGGTAALDAIDNTDFMRSTVARFGTPLKGDAEAAANQAVFTVDGVRYAVPKAIERDIQSVVMPLFNDKQMRDFVAMWDKGTKEWRKWATVMSPGFWLRNAQSNYYLSWAKGYGDISAWNEAGQIRFGKLKPTDTIRFKKPMRVNGRLTQEIKVGEWIDIASRRGAWGGGNSLEVVEDGIRKLEKRGPIARYQDFGSDVNSHFEDWGRLAVFKQAFEKTGSLDVAASVVDSVLYDYDPASLTKVEQSLRSIFPFFTWIRRNLPSQLENALHRPGVITVFDKMNRASGEEIDKGILPKYMAEMQPIALPFEVGGMKQMLNPNFGFQDLNNLAPKEAGTAVLSMLHPVIKAVLEGVMNKSTYYDRELEEYPGQLVPAPAWLTLFAKVAVDEPWFKRFATKAGMNVHSEKGLMMKPGWVNVLNLNPFLSNVGRIFTPGPQQGGRIGSFAAGVKTMPYEEEKFRRNNAYEDRQMLLDTLQKLKDDEVIPKNGRRSR